MHKSGKAPTEDPLAVLDDKKLWGHLPTTKSKLEGTERRVISPSSVASRTERHGFRDRIGGMVSSILQRNNISDAYSQIKGFRSSSKVFLLTVATENDTKAAVIFLPFKLFIEKLGCEAILLKLNASSGVGGQPYGLKAGVTGMSQRAGNVLIENITKINETIKEHQVQALFTGSIENYIEPHVSVKTPDGVEEDRAVDYGAALYFNPATGYSMSLLSGGVTVPKEFLKAAKSFGYLNKEKTHGKVTVGECIHFKIPEIKAADWHKVVLGKGEGNSRFDILKMCTTRILAYCLTELLRCNIANSQDSSPETTHTTSLSQNRRRNASHERARSRSLPPVEGSPRKHYR